MPLPMESGNGHFSTIAVIAACVGVLVLSLLLSMLLIRLNPKFRLTDYPAAGKVHSRPVPRSGGIAIFLSLAAGVAWLKITNPMTLRDDLWLLPSLFVVFATGLLDDRLNLKPIVKFILVAVAAVLLVRQSQDLSIAAALALVLVIVFVTNSVNLLDGIDGLAGGAMLISLVGFAGIFARLSISSFSILCLVSASAITGFLLFNLRGRIFMGDCGSLMLGFLVGALLLKLADFGWKPFLSGAVCAAIPVFDTCFVVLRRAVLRRPLFVGDLNHSYNLLMSRFGDLKKTLAVFYAAAIVLAGCALFLLGG